MNYKYQFGFMLKSYKRDLQLAIRLVKSYIQYNVEKLPLFIVIPADDYKLFVEEIPNKSYIFILKDEDIPVEYMCEQQRKPVGWYNQQIAKLAFWKTGLCRNYSCLDSDACFINPIRSKRFMYDAEIPYTILFEDNDLKADDHYYQKHWVRRERYIRKIYKEIGLKDVHLITCHGFQTFSADVLENFQQEFLDKKGYSYIDLINIAPYEVSWYNVWLQKSGIIPIYSCESHFKTYHTKRQWRYERLKGINEKSLKRSYVGIIMNSNYFGHKTGFCDVLRERIIR